MKGKFKSALREIGKIVDITQNTLMCIDDLLKCNKKRKQFFVGFYTSNHYYENLLLLFEDNKKHIPVVFSSLVDNLCEL